MPRPREPIKLVEMKGKKHLTKAEIQERKDGEVHGNTDEITPPSFLSAKQKREFEDIAKEMLRIDIMTNLDCDALARYIQARDKYIKYNKMLAKTPNDFEHIQVLEKVDGLQDRAFKQCNTAARELGLTISSRCRLVVPKKEEAPRENKFSKFGGVHDG